MQTLEIENRKRALQLLGEWVPSTVLGRARQQAEEIARDEYVRTYIAKHALLIVLALFASLAASFATVICLARLVPWPEFVPAELMLPLVLLDAVLFFVMFLAPPIFLMFHLEKRALRKMAID
jgi:hypothetical protein